MNKEKEIISIYFYQSPKIPKNSKHKIDFLDENDKFNPFAEVNKFASCKMINQNIIDVIALDLISIDLDNDINRLNVYKVDFSDMLHSCISVLMDEFNIEFKRISNYFCQTMFAKLVIPYGVHEIVLQCQLLGVQRKHKIKLTGVYVMQFIIDRKCIVD